MFFMMFAVSIICLILGYIFYGRFMAKVYNLDNHNVTPAERLNDGMGLLSDAPRRRTRPPLLVHRGRGPHRRAYNGGLDVRLAPDYRMVHLRLHIPRRPA